MPVETAPSTTTAQPAETTSAGSDVSSFLGVEPESLPSLQPRESSAPGGDEPTGDESVVESEVEEGEAEEEIADELAPEETTEELSEETADDWLPTEQEKEFPLEVLQRYAPRYGYTAEEIAADPRLQVVLKDKLNSDIYVQQLREETENPNFEETTPEGTEETVADPNTTAQPADAQKEYYQRVDALVSKFDPKATEELGRNLLSAFGVNTDVKKLEAMLADPKVDAATKAEVQGAIALVRNAGQVGTTLARGAIDLVLTSLPEILPAVMESIAPGLLGAYQGWSEVNVARTAWTEVADARGPQGQPLYSNLPQYGTKEFGALTVRAERELGLKQGALGEMAQRGFVREAYTMVAQVASGQRVSSRDVSRAVNAGRQQERTQQQRRATGRALGAGSQSRQFGHEEEADPVRDALRQAISEQNTQADPFRGATARR